MGKKILIFVIILLMVSLPVNADAQTYSTKDEVYNVIIDNLLAHKEKFTVTTSVKTMKEIGTDTDLFYAATAVDNEDTSKDADYLGVSVSSWSQSWRWSSLGGTATLTFSAVYRTTLNQEKKVDAKIESVLEKLNLENVSDYKKVKAVHDYIVKRVSYDQTLKKHSVYNALINKSSVCEGYAAAAYRMLTDLGVECRIITGTADGDSHSWNIVKVDGKWYNLDLTWDDPITNTGEQIIRYDYFLKNDKNFSDHERDPEYSTQEFLDTYPISATDYK